MTVTGERLLLLRSVCISKPCPFTNPQCCYFKRPRPPKKKTFVKHIVSGSAILRSCPVSLHHMISFTRAINHPVRFKLSGLTCFGFFFFFFWCIFTTDFWKTATQEKKQKKQQKKTKKQAQNPRIYIRHCANWSKTPHSNRLPFFLPPFSFLSSYTSAQNW